MNRRLARPGILLNGAMLQTHEEGAGDVKHKFSGAVTSPGPFSFSCLPRSNFLQFSHLAFTLSKLPPDLHQHSKSAIESSKMAKTTCLYEEQVQYLHEVINHGHLTPEQKIELLKHLPVPNKACTSTNHPSQSDESKKSESFNSFKARVSDPIIVHTDHPFDARLNGPSKREKRNQTRGSAMFRLPAQSQFDQTESTTTHLIGSRVYASAR